MADLTSHESLPDCIFGSKASSNNGKSEDVMSAGTSSQIPACPKCQSERTWYNGHRDALFGEPIRRLICRDCGYRFSDPADVARAKKELKDEQFIESKGLKRSVPLGTNCQICDKSPAKGTKNLVTEPIYQQQLVVPQKEAYDEKDNRGAVVNFIFWCQQNEKASTTVSGYSYNLMFLISAGANLFDPFSVKEVLTIKLKDKTKIRKYNLTKAYKAFAAAYHINIQPAGIPAYKPERKIPYLPPEEHLDILIAACASTTPELAAYLQFLKETAARPVETFRVQREDIDFIQKIVRINHPAKNCNARAIPVSEKLITMLQNLPQDRAKLFLYKNERSAAKTLRVIKNRVAANSGIPEIKRIHPYTFRYWRATVEYQETQREVTVMILLGHTSCKYIYIYVQLAHVYFGGGPQKYIPLWVTTREQEDKAVEEGYEYVRTTPDGASLYRKANLKAARLIGHD